MSLDTFRKALLAFLTLLGLCMAIGGKLTGAGPAIIVAGVVIIMAAHWILEGMPVGATSLIPLVAFPFLEVVPAKEVAKAYMSSTIFLLVGGFFLAKGLERWKVPEVIAEGVERAARGSPHALLAGMMVTTCFLSMWLSNTATTLIMATVALSTLARAKEAPENDAKDLRLFQVALFLGIAYAANIGGLATPVGTAPNAVLLAQLEKLTPEATPISFVSWMGATLPLVIVLIPAVYAFLAFVSCRFPKTLSLGQSEQRAQKLSRGGKIALVIFAFTAIAWITRSDIRLGFATIPGWSTLIGVGKNVDDGSVAMMGAILMFLCPTFDRPSGEEDAPFASRVLDWKNANEIPWYLVLLFGGGLALADAFKKSGLSVWLGEQLVWLEGAPIFVLVLVLCLGMSLLTEVTSNTATTTLVLPVLFSAAGALNLAPLWVMFPATLCASAAFILPISTPPNAIASGAGDITPAQMARVGAPLNLIAVILVSLIVVFFSSRILGF